MYIQKKYYPYIIGGILLALLIYFPLFGHLNGIVLRIWDEARLAINAYEMNKNGNYIVTHYDGSPDMWNTKPPLMVWCQVFWMKMIGVNELSVRLPSAIAAVLTCCALLFLSVKYLKNFWFGFMASLVLITINGYITYHGARAGDYDALLTLFTTLYCVFLLIYFETKQRKYLYLFFVALTFSVLTKGVSGFFFFPGLLIYALWQKEFIPLLKNKDTYIGIAIFLFFIVGYYVLREHYNPGYLKAVYENELGGRFAKGLEGHKKWFWFYFEELYYSNLGNWIWFIPCGIFIGLFHKNKKIVKITGFSTILSVTFLLLISIAKTKLPWYQIPIYPFIAVIIAVFIDFIFSFFTTFPYFKKYAAIKVLPFVFLFLFFYQPYQIIFKATYRPQDSESGNNQFYRMGYFLRNAVKGKQDLNNFIFLYDGYSAHNTFYINILNDKGANISRKYWVDIEPGDKVFFYQENVKDYIHEHFQYEVLPQDDNAVSTYLILDKK